MKELCQRESCSLASSSPWWSTPGTRTQGKVRDQAGLLYNGNNYPKKLQLFLLPTEVAHALRQRDHPLLLFTRCGTRHLLPQNRAKNPTQATLEDMMGNLWWIPLTRSGRAFLNPHRFGQIDTNCPSKELRFILKRFQIQLLKLLFG